MSGELVLIPSLYERSGNSMHDSQHAGRAIEKRRPLRAMTCSPIDFVYV